MPASRIRALTAICLAYFMVILDATIVSVALVDLRADLGTGIGALQWVVDGYTLAFAALLLTGGALGDRLGARGVFRAGLILFTAASLACGVAPSIGALVAARVAQGAGAALMVPASLALLQAAFADRASRARAVGAWAAVAGIAAASGPVLGGLLAQTLGWRAVFFVNLPVGALALALAARHVPATEPNHARRLDPAAQAVGVAGLAVFTLALIEAGDRGWGAPEVLAGLAAGPAAAAVLVAIERRADSPMLPPALFARPGFSPATAVGLLINLGFYGQLFVISISFQQVRGLSALQTGLALLPEAGLVALASFASGRITSTAGSPRPTMLFGLALGGAGLLGLALAGEHTAYALLVAPLMATGVGIALTVPAATTAVLEAAPDDRAGIASGVLNAARQVGGAIGVALLGTLVAGSAGFGAGLAVASAAFAAGAVIVALSPGTGSLSAAAGRARTRAG